MRSRSRCYLARRVVGTSNEGKLKGIKMPKIGADSSSLLLGPVVKILHCCDSCVEVFSAASPSIIMKYCIAPRKVAPDVGIVAALQAVRVAQLWAGGKQSSPDVTSNFAQNAVYCIHPTQCSAIKSSSTPFAAGSHCQHVQVSPEFLYAHAKQTNPSSIILR
ncbi:hypothetical protein Aduo_018861 [Ancylostoma duodenale]